MTKPEKLNLATLLLDELATVGYLENERYKLQALYQIREYLKPFNAPLNPTKVDRTLETAKLVANIDTPDLNRQLNGLAVLVEKALGEIHLNTAKSIINGL